MCFHLIYLCACHNNTQTDVYLFHFAVGEAEAPWRPVQLWGHGVDSLRSPSGSGAQTVWDTVSCSMEPQRAGWDRETQNVRQWVVMQELMAFFLRRQHTGSCVVHEGPSGEDGATL